MHNSSIKYIVGKVKHTKYITGDPLIRLRNESLPELKLTDAQYKPSFKFGDNKQNWNNNCCKEYLERCRIGSEVIRDSLSKAYNKFIPFANSPRYIMSTEPSLGVYCTYSHRWIKYPQPMEDSYQCVFDGKDIIDIQVQDCDTVEDYARNFKQNSQYLIVDKTTRLINDMRLYHACRALNTDRISEMKVTLVEGVPGCAKTTQIVEAFEEGDLVLSATREGAGDIRERIEALKGDTFERNSVATIDSFLLRNDQKRYTNVYVDEGFMCHAGQLLYAALKAGTNRLIVFGDSNQIPFVNRLGTIKPIFHDINDVDHNTVVRSHSYRITMDTAAILNSLRCYSEKVTTSNHTQISLHVKQYNQKHIPRDKQILVFTQSEKATLIRDGFKRVNTAGEYQGKQCDDVVVVRSNPKPLSIYDNINQMIVLLSRHRKSCTYYTVCANDALAKLMTRRIPHQVIKDCYAKPKKLPALRGGFTNLIQYPENLVSFRLSKYNKTLHQRRAFREFTYSNGFDNIIPAKVVAECVPIFTVKPPCIQQYAGTGDISTLQDAYEVIQPMGGIMELDYLYQNSEMQDYNICVDHIRFNPEAIPRLAPSSRMTPVLRTALLPPVVDSWQQVVKAYTDRNGNPPELDSPVSADPFVESVVDRFVHTYIGDMQLFHAYVH